jgi:hypothetical protein
MQIQYVSDLHLNDFPDTKPFSDFVRPGGAPILVVAGDVCPADHPLYEPFLRWCSRGWRHVLVIAGNHEYFCTVIPRNMDAIDKEIERICAPLPNVIFLQGSRSVVLEGVRFVGTTLWSDVNPAIWDEIGEKGDYTSTYVDGRKRTPADTVALHRRHKAELAAAIQRYREPLVVVTHHLPSRTLVSPEYRGTPTESCYVSDCDELFRAPVKLWICGHAHRQGKFIVKSREGVGIPCVMNALGYASQTEAIQAGEGIVSVL